MDRGSLVCRVCGEDNHPDAWVPPGEELRDDELTLPTFLDQLGEWSEIKHQIIDSYAHAYTTILSKQPAIKRLVYIDSFAGSGVAIDRKTDVLLAGSPYRALTVQPPFDEFHFIELDPEKVEELEKWVGDDPRVTIHQGDANRVLLADVLPRCRYEDFARGLCFLDPYGLSVDWEVITTIGKMRSVEIFFNFMVVGANRNVLWKDLARVSSRRRELMNRFWGDESWLDVAYQPVADLFGTKKQKIGGNDALIEAYRQRLKDAAGFRFVPEPIPMKNSRNATVYYLFFASPNATANKIVSDIFRKYRQP